MREKVRTKASWPVVQARQAAVHALRFHSSQRVAAADNPKQKIVHEGGLPERAWGFLHGSSATIYTPTFITIPRHSPSESSICTSHSDTNISMNFWPPLCTFQSGATSEKLLDMDGGRVWHCGLRPPKKRLALAALNAD